MMKVAKEPIFYEKQLECPFLLDLKLKKTAAGFFELLRYAPEIIQNSPLLQNKTFGPDSTCARKVVEVAGDGSLSAAALSFGYFPLMIANTAGFPHGKTGLLRVGANKFQNWLWSLGSAAAIGTAIVVIPEEELDMWPGETAVQRIQEDLTSVFLRLKTSLVPFGTIIIKKQLQQEVESVKSDGVVQVDFLDDEGEFKCLEQRVDLQAVMQGAGLKLSRCSGHFRLDWNPTEVVTGRTPTSSTQAFDDFLASLDVTSLMQLFIDILDKTPQRGVPMSLRLARVKRGRLISSMTVSEPNQSLLLPSPTILSGTQPDELEKVESPTSVTECSTVLSVEKEALETGPFKEPSNSQIILEDGFEPLLEVPAIGS